MRKPDNERVRLGDFKHQLTHYMSLDDLAGPRRLLAKEGGKRAYGKTYVIKMCMDGEQHGKYAIFTKGDLLESPQPPGMEDGVDDIRKLLDE